MLVIIYPLEKNYTSEFQLRTCLFDFISLVHFISHAIDFRLKEHINTDRHRDEK